MLKPRARSAVMLSVSAPSVIAEESRRETWLMFRN